MRGGHFCVLTGMWIFQHITCTGQPTLEIHRSKLGLRSTSSNATTIHAYNYEVCSLQSSFYSQTAFYCGLQSAVFVLHWQFINLIACKLEVKSKRLCMGTLPNYTGHQRIFNITGVWKTRKSRIRNRKGKRKRNRNRISNHWEILKPVPRWNLSQYIIRSHSSVIKESPGELWFKYSSARNIMSNCYWRRSLKVQP